MRNTVVANLLTPLRALASRVPSQCAVCRSWPSRRLCESCVARFAQPVARCAGCALRIPPGADRCGTCRLQPPAFDDCLAAVDYAYPWIDALAQFKFQGDPAWAGALSMLMRSAPWVERALEDADRVLPVPLSVERLRTRGFNQAALLARRLAPGKADDQTLIRLRTTDQQSGLTRAQRLRNLRGAFAVEPARAAALQGCSLVLIDDVMTTGATLQAAALALREGGAARITAVVLARTDAP